MTKLNENKLLESHLKRGLEFCGGTQGNIITNLQIYLQIGYYFYFCNYLVKHGTF